MKITDITAYPVWAGQRNFLFVVVDTDEGIYGVGEAGLTSREQAVMGAFQDFKDVLVGQDPFRIEHIWQLLFRGGFFPAQRVLSSAISAIDIALWDIKGKALGVPIYELLGGRVRDKVVCYPHKPRPCHGSRAAGRKLSGNKGAGLEVRTLGAAPGRQRPGTPRRRPYSHSPIRGRAVGGWRRDRHLLRCPHAPRSS